jgi:hypothetical protein
MRLIRLFQVVAAAVIVLLVVAGDASAFGKRGKKSACQSADCQFTGGNYSTVGGVVYSTCSGGKCELASVPTGAAFTVSDSPAAIVAPEQPTASVVDGSDALDEVNALRARRGLRPYVRDPNLTEGARRLAAARAAGRVFGHLANDFALIPGPAACTGCAAYPPSYGWMSCAVYDSYTYAGAAWVMGADGKRYMHLVCR